MTSKQMTAKLDEQPFQPFRLQMSDGMHYDVKKSSSALVMSGVFALAVDDDPETGEPTRIVYVDPHHVTRMKDLERKKLGGFERP